MSPTKQARGDSGKEPKQSGGQFSSGQTNQQFVPTTAKSDCKGSTGSEVFSRWLSRWWGPHWGSVCGAHLGVLVSADIQGCRRCLWVLIHHLIWLRTGSGDCSDHLGWIRTGSGGYGDLGIREKQTNVSVDVNLLTM